jgi:hypothetical protein
MKQFSIKNDAAGNLLEQVTAITGEGKTEAVIHALELYRDKLMVGPDVVGALDSLRRNVHDVIKPENLGEQPSKAEIEKDLGMP